jgi:type III secretory pathway lipoprotein EscJ
VTANPWDAERFVEEFKDELTGIDRSPVNEHAEAFELLHQKLESSLSTIDGL